MKTACLSAFAFLLLVSQSFAQTAKPQKGASVPPAVIPHKFEAKVVSVLDGDTIRVANAEISVATVRLELFERLALVVLRELPCILGDQRLINQVVFEVDVTKQPIVLVALFPLDCYLLLEQKVMQVLGCLFTVFLARFGRVNPLELTAKTQKRGLWGREAPIAPWDYRDGVRPAKPASEPTVSVVAASGHAPAKTSIVAAGSEQTQAKTKVEETTVYLTKTGTHYRRAGCRHLSKSAIPIPLSRASGYTPCQHCNPPK